MEANINNGLAQPAAVSEPQQMQQTAGETQQAVTKHKSEYASLARSLHLTVGEVQTVLTQVQRHAQCALAAITVCEDEKKKHALHAMKDQAAATIKKLRDFGNTYPGIQQFPENPTADILCNISLACKKLKESLKNIQPAQHVARRWRGTHNKCAVCISAPQQPPAVQQAQNAPAQPPPASSGEQDNVQVQLQDVNPRAAENEREKEQNLSAGAGDLNCIFIIDTTRAISKRRDRKAR